MQHRTTRGSLCQPGERREGICPQQPCGARRGGLIIKYPAHPCTGLEPTRGGRQKTGKEMRMDGESRGDHFAGEHVFGTMTLMSSVCH